MLRCCPTLSFGKARVKELAFHLGQSKTVLWFVAHYFSSPPEQLRKAGLPVQHEASGSTAALAWDPSCRRGVLPPCMLEHRNRWQCTACSPSGSCMGVPHHTTGGRCSPAWHIPPTSFVSQLWAGAYPTTLNPPHGVISWCCCWTSINRHHLLFPWAGILAVFKKKALWVIC